MSDTPAPGTATQPAQPIPQAAPAGAVAAMAAASAQGGSHAPAATCATCPSRSLRFKLGWTFAPDKVPTGQFQLIPGMSAPAPIPANGKIVLDVKSGVQIPPQIAQGELVVIINNGPTYRFTVHFDLPPIHEAAGLKRRLTNLGLYAGNDAQINGRFLWAMRAFKRIHMNGFARNRTVPEDDRLQEGQSYQIQAQVMAAVQAAHGPHPADQVTALTPDDALLQRHPTQSPDAGMFGGVLLARASYETHGADDSDPRPDRPRAVWAGQVNPTLHASRPGYELCLGAYDEKAGEAPVENCVNLPQPIHMLQFALFETGYWMVAGGRGSSSTISRFGPPAAVGASNIANGVFATMDGSYGRATHWAVRELQCHAKMPKAAVEDLTVQGTRYVERLITKPAATLSGHALYPVDGRVSGAVNEATARALQSWLDQSYRCPILIYAAPNASARDHTKWTAENLWFYDDLPSTSPRMFALDFSGNYDIPPEYGALIDFGGQRIPQPITVGEYTNYAPNSGPQTVVRHLWNLTTTEVTPQTVYGQGGLDGRGLSAGQLSTFKVIKAAAIYECLGHYDSMNAYDRVTLSFGLCHWTLAMLTGSEGPDSAWEMGGLFAFAQSQHGTAYNQAFGRFGISATKTWPFNASVSGKWASTVQMQTEAGSVILCGVNTDAEENKYGKNWHFYYRALMANRTIPDFQLALGAFAAKRIDGMLSHRFTAGGRSYELRDFLTSEKAVAMAHRAHIYGPNSMVGASSSQLPARLAQVLASHPQNSAAREVAVREAIERATRGDAQAHVQAINGWSALPSRGIMDAQFQSVLTDNTLSGAPNSFIFASP